MADFQVLPTLQDAFQIVHDRAEGVYSPIAAPPVQDALTDQLQRDRPIMAGLMTNGEQEPRLIQVLKLRFALPARPPVTELRPHLRVNRSGCRSVRSRTRARQATRLLGILDVALWFVHFGCWVWSLSAVALRSVFGDSSESAHTMIARFTLYPCCRLASYSSSKRHGTLWPSGSRAKPCRWMRSPVVCSHTEPAMCFHPGPGRRANRRTSRCTECRDCVSGEFMAFCPGIGELVVRPNP